MSNTNKNGLWFETEVGAGIISKKYFHDGEKTAYEMFERISNCFSEELKPQVYNALVNADFFPGGRSLYALGCKGKFKATPSNCYVLPAPDDDLSSILDVGKEMAIIFSKGGGCGADLSKLRPRGAKVSNVAKTSTGAVSFMEIYNTIGGIISQNGRRGALLLALDCFHPDIEEFLEVKQNNTAIQSANISIKFDNAFMEAVADNTEYELHFKVNDTGENLSRRINAKDFFYKFCESNRKFAEPGAIFIDEVREHNLMSNDKDYEINVCNPCLTYDMKLLTSDGYKEIGTLDGTEVSIINKDGSTVLSKVWCSGEKEIVNLVGKNREVYLKCTPDHRFMTTAGEEIYAKDVKGQRLMPFIRSSAHLLNREYIKYGFLQGDGQLSRLNSEAHRGLEVNIGEKDSEIISLFNLTADDFQSNGRKAYISGYNEKLIELGFDAKILPERVFPSKYLDFSVIEKLSFLRGCFSANGSVIKGHRVSYKTTCETLANQLADALMTFGINSYLTCTQAKDVKFSNGIYTCRKSFDVNITTYKSVKLFAELIGFEQEYKRQNLKELIVRKSPALYCKFTNKAEKVYDFTEPETHWGVVEGFVTHNCGEFFAKEYNSCNLGSINLYNIISNPHTDNAIVDWNKLKQVVDLSVKALDEILDYGYDLQPLDKNREDIENYRSIGLGVFGLADALIALGINYSNSTGIVQSIMREIFIQALRTSNELAKEKGCFKKCVKSNITDTRIMDYIEINETELWEDILEFGLRNSTLLSIAPTGSIATMSGLSGGVEPLFQVAYRRTTHSLVGEGRYFDVYAKSVYDLLVENKINPDSISIDAIKKQFAYVEDAHDIEPLDRIDVQASIQQYVDNAISSTINMKKGTTADDIMKAYLYAWEAGCKGITVFVDGCERTAIMGEKAPEMPQNDAIVFDSIKPIKREEVTENDDGLLGKSYRGSTACVPKLYTQVNEVNGNIFEVFTNTSQGCTSNINTITRLASLALRSGVKVTEIVKELKGSNCSACLDRKKSGKKVSNSCGACIGEAIEKYYAQLDAVPKASGIVLDVGNGIFTDELNEAMMACPECGQMTLRAEGKCNNCFNCGYSRCS